MVIQPFLGILIIVFFWSPTIGVDDYHLTIGKQKGVVDLSKHVPSLSSYGQQPFNFTIAGTESIFFWGSRPLEQCSSVSFQKKNTGHLTKPNVILVTEKKHAALTSTPRMKKWTLLRCTELAVHLRSVRNGHPGNIFKHNLWIYDVFFLQLDDQDWTAQI